MHGLYLIAQPPPEKSFSTWLTQVEQALLGGACLLQYREKNIDASLRLERAHALQLLCEKYHVPFIVNDCVTTAKKLGVGVHLGQTDSSIAEARKQLGTETIIGATCHNSLALAQQADEQGASYLAFGRFFPSSTKPEAPAATLSVLAAAKQKFKLPIVAIGGITLHHAPKLIAAGADLLAVAQGVFGEKNPRKTCESFQKLFREKT